MADPRVLAGRHVAAAAFADPETLDRLFVRDYVAALPIGVFDSEKGRAQRVRFDADLWVRPYPGPADDRFDKVVSYDLVMDGVAALKAELGHVELVETWAERLAAHLLADPRVRKVRVRVTKLDVGPGGVGVEIERRQPPAEAVNVRRLRRE